MRDSPSKNLRYTVSPTSWQLQLKWSWFQLCMKSSQYDESLETSGVQIKLDDLPKSMERGNPAIIQL